MANFTTLTSGKTTEGSIKNWVSRTDIPSTTILTEAQALIYQKLRVREMMTRDTLTASSGVSQVAAPSDFLDPISIVPYGWADGLDYQNEARFVQHMDEDGVVQEGTPSAFTVIGTLIVFDVKTTATWNSKILYFAKPAALAVTSNETNFLTERYPTLLRHACLVFAYEHMKDEKRSLGYRQMVEAEAAEASMNDDLFRRGQR